MFKVTPIGSCRIAGPLRYGETSYGIRLNQARCYGYCHSPAEAVQMVEFMQGASNFSADVWPLVSRAKELNTVSGLKHDTSDLYVIELSSAKEVTLDGVSIQLNYLNSFYSDFFADKKRVQDFWALAQDKDANAMRAFLDQTWSENDFQREEAKTLSKIRLNLVSRDSLRQNITKLMDMLPDVLFVSHIDGRKPDGGTIRSRSEFIQLVTEEVQGAGGKIYNPTDLMTEFGQTHAIDDESTGLAHYTKPFSDAVMDDWMRQFIAPVTNHAVRSGNTAAAKLHLDAQITAAMRDGRFSDAETRLVALTECDEQIEVLAKDVEAAKADAQSKFSAQAQCAFEGKLDAIEANHLVLRAGALGLFDLALNLASHAEGGLKALPIRTLLWVGDRAKDADDTDNMFEFYLAAVCQNQTLGRATQTLVEMSIKESINILSELEPDAAAALLHDLNPVQKIDLLRLDGAPLTNAISEDTPSDDLADIARHVSVVAGLEQASDLIAQWCRLTKTNRIKDETITAVLDQWVDAAQHATSRIDQIKQLNAVLHADPRHQGARNAMRDLRADLVNLIRFAGKHADIDALEAMERDVDALNADLPEFDLWRARLQYGQGEYARALEHGQSAATHLPDSVGVWVLLMRSAQKLKNSAKASEFAQRVVDLACGKTEKLKKEAEAVLHSQLAGV